jgi:hypothetical protein
MVRLPKLFEGRLMFHSRDRPALKKVIRAMLQCFNVTAELGSRFRPTVSRLSEKFAPPSMTRLRPVCASSLEKGGRII